MRAQHARFQRYLDRLRDAWATAVEGPRRVGNGRAGCVPCHIARTEQDAGRLVVVRPGWIANVGVNDGGRPRIVLQTVQHTESFAELSDEQRFELGTALERLEGAVRGHTGAVRVYVQLLNEAAPPHVHMHVLPRLEDDAAVSGPRLIESPLPTERAAALRDRLWEALNDMPPPPLREPSAVVRGMRRATAVWDRCFSLYRSEWFYARPGRRGDGWHTARDRLETGERYVGRWLVLQSLLLAYLSLPWSETAAPPLRWIAGLVLVYRSVDLILFEFGLLLRVEPSPLRSIPRQFVLKVANLGEVVLGGSAAFILAGLGPGEAIRRGLATASLQSDFSLDSGAALLVQTVTTASTGLLLLGGLAMIVGKLGETFYRATEDRGPMA